MLDAPVSGRIFFEQVIRDNLDLGRPDRVSLIFARQIQRGHRKPAPGRFRTRVITQHVTPSLYVDYKHTTIKQYHKEGRALRTETTINDTYDFAIGRRLTNLPALRKIGFSANRRLLDVQRLSHDPADGAAALNAITAPAITPAGQRVAGMRFTDPRAQALLSAICVFRLLPRGFTNRDLRHHLAPLLGLSPEAMTSGQITYDLRRLRHHGLIERIPRTHRYQITGTGRPPRANRCATPSWSLTGRRGRQRGMSVTTSITMTTESSADGRAVGHDCRYSPSHTTSTRFGSYRPRRSSLGLITTASITD
jgi:hypothetical protein